MISAPTLALAISVVPLGAGSKSAATGAPATLLAPSQTAVRAAVGSTLRASALVASVTASSSAGLVASGASCRRRSETSRATESARVTRPFASPSGTTRTQYSRPVVGERYSNERISPRSAAR